jgi:hypothetical protein
VTNFEGKIIICVGIESLYNTLFEIWIMTFKRRPQFGAWEMNPITISTAKARLLRFEDLCC